MVRQILAAPYKFGFEGGEVHPREHVNGEHLPWTLTAQNNIVFRLFNEGTQQWISSSKITFFFLKFSGVLRV